MNEPLICHADWMATGHLAKYVRRAGSIGGRITVVESAQPAGDMSDPPTSDLILARIVGRDLRQTSDFGFGRFSERSPANSFCLIPANVASHILVDDDHVIRCFALPLARCRTLLADHPTAADAVFPTLHRGSFRSPFLSALTDNLTREMAYDDGFGALAADGAMLSILAELARLAKHPLRRSTGGLAPWQLKRACEAMDAAIDSNLSLDELATIAGCSPTHFSRAFKQSTGRAPFHWLAERRIERAKALLEDNRLPIAEIALAVGFSAQPQFTTAFGRATGVTPARWRRERLG